MPQLHAYTDIELNLILSGAKKSLAIERVFRGFTATILEKYAASGS